MEKSAKYFTVGVFVTVTVFLLVSFLIWLAGPHDKSDYKFFTVEFTDPVTGVEEGADVLYKGVKVGKVMKMGMVPNNSELIRMDIGVDKSTPVRAHTQVVLQAQGITGLVRLEMATANSDTEMPQKRDGLQYPVLVGEGSRLEKAMNDIPAITSKMSDIMGRVDNIIIRNRANIDRFSSQGLSQFTEASQEIKGTAASLHKLSDKLDDNPSQILYQPSAHGVEIPQ